MEALRELFEELNQPSAAKLLAAARKRKILNVTAQQAKEVAQTDSTRQVFTAKAFPQKGSIPATNPRDRWQADLLSFQQYDAAQNKGSKYALIVVQVFDRQVKIADLKTKTPEDVWSAFQEIMGKFSGKPSRLDVDGAEEWGGGFAEQAQKAGISIQTRSPSDVNYLAVLDKASQTIKSNLFRALAKGGNSKWAEGLQKATNAYNQTSNSATLDEAPADVEKEKVVQFKLMQQNSEKLKTNNEQLGNRQQQLRDAGNFRVRLPKQSFQRGFKARYSNEVHEVASIDKGQVTDTKGRTFRIGQVKPVPKGSRNIDVPAELARGSVTRDRRQEEELAKFNRPLRNFLGNEAKGMAVVGTFLRQQEGFEQTLSDLRLNRPGGLRQALERMGPEFQISSTGRGQPTVKVRPATRLRGKQ